MKNEIAITATGDGPVAVIVYAVFLLFLTIPIIMAATIATSKSVIKIVARFCESHESISHSSLISVKII